MRTPTISIAERISADSSRIRAALEKEGYLFKKRPSVPIWEVMKPGANHFLTLIYAHNPHSGGHWGIKSSWDGEEAEQARSDVWAIVSEALKPTR